jgi:hypothetical protein
LRQPAIAEQVAILSDQSNREDRKKKEGFFFFQKRGDSLVLVNRGCSWSWDQIGGVLGIDVMV